MISIWNQLKQIKVRGKKSILFEEAKNIFLNHLKKTSTLEKYNEETFVNKYYYIATLEIRPKSLITLWEKDDNLLVRTTGPRECSAWTEQDVKNHLVKNFQQSRL